LTAAQWRNDSTRRSNGTKHASDRVLQAFSYPGVKKLTRKADFLKHLCYHHNNKPESEAEPELESEPVWILKLPELPHIEYRAASLILEPAAVSEIKALGEERIYFTIQCDCVFTGYSMVC